MAKNKQKKVESYEPLSKLKKKLSTLELKEQAEMVECTF